MHSFFNMDLFPYKPRKNQTAIMQTIKNTLSSKGDIVFESGTGSGKTICTLTATLKYALENNKKIIYSTRTNAQQRQVILELTEIRNKITEVGETVTGNFFYMNAGKNQNIPYCVYSFFANEMDKDTKDEYEMFYFQIFCDFHNIKCTIYVSFYIGSRIF